MVNDIVSKDVNNAVLDEVLCVYDGFGPLSEEFQEASGRVGASTGAVRYFYDDTAVGGALTKGGRLRAMEYPNGRMITYKYAAGTDDALNRVTTICPFSQNLGR